MNNVRRSPEPVDPLIQAALQEYLERIDRGETVDRDEFLKRHAPIAGELQAFIETSEEIRRMAQSQTDHRSAEEAADVTTHSFARNADETVPPRRGELQNQENPNGELAQQFGRYRVLKPLGRGAMGTVYLAEDTQLERLVALKTPHFDENDGGDILQRFYREARVAATLRHPNICPVYDVGTIDGRHYISMAYIEGRLLSSYIVPGEPQSERNVLMILRKLAGALQLAHDHGIVHRDLKPGNVMIDARGEPIIMDFGLAHQATNESQVRLTQSGMLVGSPAYMSPEQVDGDLTKLGPATDQYSLGVMFYELLTGQLPFQGSLAAVLGQIVVKQPKPPRELRPGLDPRIEAVCLRMMAKSPQDRFKSLKAVTDELAAILRNPAAPATAHPQPVEPTKSSADSAPPTAEVTRTRLTTTMASTETGAVTQSNLESLAVLARKLLARHDYEQVVQMLEQIPEKKRNDEVRALLAKARALFDEVAFLLTEIDEALRLRDRPTALKKAKRLLELKPGHQRAIQVQEQIGRAGKSRRPGSRSGIELFGKRIGEGTWFPWAAIAFGFAVFAGMYGAVVMYLRVGDAVVRVEILDPEVKVGLQGRTLTIESAREPLKIRAGDGNTLRIEYSGLIFTSDSFTLKKGDNPAVVVQLLDAKLAAKFGDAEIGAWSVPAKSHQASNVAARIGPAKAHSKPTTVPAPALDQPLNALDGPVEFVKARDLTGHRGQVHSVAFSGDGRRCITGSLDKTACVWDVATGNRVATLAGHTDEIVCVGLNTDGRRAITGAADKSVRWWNVETGQEVHCFNGHTDLVRTVSISADGKLGASGGDDGTIRLWDLNSLSAGKVLTGHADKVASVAFSPKGETLLSGSWDRSVRLWDVRKGTQIREFPGHTGWVQAVAFSPDGRWAASGAGGGMQGNTYIGGTDLTVRIWDVATGKELHKISGDWGGIATVAFMPNGRQLLFSEWAAMRADRWLILWDIEGGKVVARYQDPTDWAPIVGMAVSPDGRQVLIGRAFLTDNAGHLLDVVRRGSGRNSSPSGESGSSTVASLPAPGRSAAQSVGSTATGGSQLPAGPPGQPLRWFSASVHDPSAFSAVAPYINVVQDRSWQQSGDALVQEARKRGMPVVVAFFRNEFPAIEQKLFDFVRKNRDVVAGVSFLSPYYKAEVVTPGQLGDFGRRLKKEFPGLTFSVAYIEMPAGMSEPLPPVPPEVDVVEVCDYFDMSPQALEAKVSAHMNNWLRRAEGRPVVLRWISKPSPTWTAAEGPLKAAPGTIRKVAELALKYKLAGVVFDQFGPRSDNWSPPIESDAVALAEFHELAATYGFLSAGSPTASKLAAPAPTVSVSPPVLPKSVIPTDAVNHQGHAYKFFNERVSWQQAKRRCEEMKGHLAKIQTAEENNFLADLGDRGFGRENRTNRETIWLGATDEAQEGRWLWLDGSPVSYKNWAPRQPNNKQGRENYATMSVSNWQPAPKGTWTDQPSESTEQVVGFICEWDSPALGETKTAVSEAWTDLFNGRDLSGWKSISGEGGATARDGVLVLTGDAGAPWIGTEQEYADFELELEYRLQPGGNSGVFLRAFDTGNPNGGGFVEVQLLDDTAPKNRKIENWQKNGAIYGAVPPSKRVASPPNQWNKLFVKAVGTQVTVVVNGTKVIDANLKDVKWQNVPTRDLNRSSGRIGLQRHGSQVEFRNLRIREINQSGT